ncbi:hypothetical protein [Clostridium sp.]
MKKKMTKAVVCLCILAVSVFIGISTYATEDPNPRGQAPTLVENA